MSRTATSTLAPTPGGLGRGLAGILDDSRRPRRDNGPGLEQLLGRQSALSPPRVRQFVTETALGAIAEGFDADAVVIVRRESHGQPMVVSSRIPPSWEESSGLTFELFGQLWQLLDSADDRAVAERIVLGSDHGWIGRQGSVNGVLAAGVVRSRPFSSAEEATLGRVIRSVAVAVGTDGPALAPGTRLSATVEPERDGWRAEVVVTGDDHRERLRSVARGSRSELAVARAAAELCGAPCEVAFAGRTELDRAVVTIVVLNDQLNSPLLGLSVSDIDDPAGPAEAVLAAMAAVGDWPPRVS